MKASAHLLLDSHLSSNHMRRKAVDAFMRFLLLSAAVVATIPLFMVLWYVFAQGFPSLNLSFFTELPRPVGEAGGGMANAIVGTGVLVLLASIVGVGWGVVSGLYLSEYGTGKIGTAVRFSCDLLASVPSIVIGLFIYEIVVRPMHRFSALAGGLALGIIMIPTVARSTEELMRLVPVHIREAGLALGLSRWKVILRIVLRGARSGIVTGVMLAIARVAGETAPLLLTAMGNRGWQSGLDQPIASLPVQIYQYAVSPFEEWHHQAWAAALVLVLVVFLLNIGSRVFLGSSSGSRE